jgi:hypothetical protein
MEFKKIILLPWNLKIFFCCHGIKTQFFVAMEFKKIILLPWNLKIFFCCHGMKNISFLPWN